MPSLRIINSGHPQAISKLILTTTSHFIDLNTEIGILNELPGIYL